MNLVERAKKLLLQPKQEWQVIAAEPHTVKDLYIGYVMILAAIPAVASFIGLSLIGFGSFRVPIGLGVVHLVLSYVLALASVYVLALLIDALAPSFDGQKDFMQALKVAAFAPTASWLAGIFTIIPALSILTILGLYSLYLLYTGLPMLMKAPEAKAIVYTLVVIVAAIVLYVVVAALTALTIPSMVRGF
ncbi:MAG TPA: Yip1 family protein [Usitatibacter sp.]|nr:Yip1 family protein [Usitatibacter sp.]